MRPCHIIQCYCTIRTAWNIEHRVPRVLSTSCFTDTLKARWAVVLVLENMSEEILAFVDLNGSLRRYCPRSRWRCAHKFTRRPSWCSGVLTCASCILTSYFILFVLVTRAELRQDVIAWCVDFQVTAYTLFISRLFSGRSCRPSATC